MAQKVAVVTGSNKGIGYAIVRGLCKRFDGIVYLTARDVQRGETAAAQLRKEVENQPNKDIINPTFHQLDITDPESVQKFHDHIKATHGGIDVLVNNAAIAFKADAKESAGVQAEQTLHVNYFSTLKTCEILFPLLRKGARVVNISSSLGHLTVIPSKSLREKLADPKLTVPQLSELVKQYVEAAKQGTHAAEWGNSSYAVSKVALSALTRIQQRLVNDRDIKVNSVHPGYVDTDITSHKGHLTIDEGAVAPLFLALDADDSVRGQYVWRDTKLVDWEGESPGMY
ncbi:short chain dehydrogenase domain-containing protein [Phthorimaea operculella]|nr:short chain dehydrogenase domain-containing protein [Phthorimaea operculella]